MVMREARLARRALLVAGAAAAALGLTATAALADDWGPRVPGKHVYDLAGALTPAQVADLEGAAASVDQAGAPTVVYLRRKDAGDATTRQDARALMDAWAVESSPGMKDGFVLLLNLRPADIQHGSAALVAGQHLGLLNDGRLQGVYDGTMKPRLAEGDLAGALSATLAQVAAAMKEPARADAAPPQQQSPSPGAVAGTLLGLGAIVAVVLGVGFLIVKGGGFRNRPPGGPPPSSGWNGGGGSSFTDSGGGSTFTGGDGGASSGSSSGGGSF
jgi:uncharacterized membrane protein YgcG